MLCPQRMNQNSLTCVIIFHEMTQHDSIVSLIGCTIDAIGRSLGGLHLIRLVITTICGMQSVIVIIIVG